ncbi:hypothetical protein Hanom_Chr17g01578771 [Helianthus anomalus]
MKEIRRRRRCGTVTGRVPVVKYVALALMLWRWRGVMVVVQHINIRSRVCFHFFPRAEQQIMITNQFKKPAK